VRKPFIWPSIIINVAFVRFWHFSLEISLLQPFAYLSGRFLMAGQLQALGQCFRNHRVLPDLDPVTALWHDEYLLKSILSIIPNGIAGFVAMTGSAVVALSLVSLFAVLPRYWLCYLKKQDIGREAAKLKQQEKKQLN
jgi:hypothetical protein